MIYIQMLAFYFSLSEAAIYKGQFAHQISNIRQEYVLIDFSKFPPVIRKEPDHVVLKGVSTIYFL